MEHLMKNLQAYMETLGEPEPHFSKLDEAEFQPLLSNNSSSS
jgi:hypothetical protein